MRILAFSPFALDTVSGNGVTLLRLQSALEARGHAFRIAVPSPADGEAFVRREAAGFRPDLLHFYHAFKTGRLIGAAGGLPAVVTISGTDLNDCLDDPRCSAAVRRALRDASVLVTYNRSLAGRAREIEPRAAAKVRVIPKGVRLGDAPFDLRAAAGLPPGAFVFLHAGGIRPVKNNLAAIDALRPLAKEAFLVFAGPVLDDACGRELAGRLAREPWVRHLPRIPHDAMASAFRASDVVLNTSISEGISNALMEAMACGRPVLASDIPGNRDLLEDGVTGALYRDLEDLGRRAASLLRDAPARERLSRAAKAHAEKTFSTEREVDALLEAYTAARA